MNNQLREALDTIIDIQDAQGTNRKRQLLEYHSNNGTLKDILYFVFNPYIKTGIRKAKWNNIKNYQPYPFDDGTIQGQFTYLSHNNTGRDIDIARTKSWIDVISEPSNPNWKRFEQVLCDIFTKDLKIGISTTTINKVFPDLIPGFGIQLACKWQDNIELLKNQNVFITEKLDGNRCLAHVENHKVTFYSRSGREINGLDDVGEELSKLVDGWYDGELLAKSFNDTQSTIRKKGNKKDIIFNIFDYISNYEVQNQYSLNNYSLRRQALNEIFKSVEKFQYNKVVPLLYEGIFNEEILLSLLNMFTSSGSEGLMINLDTPYQFGRTNQLLKVKNMNTADLKIIGIQEGRGEFANTCGALIVDYKGYSVGVGSGLNKMDREYFWNNKEEIIGRIAEIQYFSETKDQNNHLSLRFPVFLRLREDGKNISYN